MLRNRTFYLRLRNPCLINLTLECVPAARYLVEDIVVRDLPTAFREWTAAVIHCLVELITAYFFRILQARLVPNFDAAFGKCKISSHVLMKSSFLDHTQIRCLVAATWYTLLLLPFAWATVTFLLCSHFNSHSGMFAVLMFVVLAVFVARWAEPLQGRVSPFLRHLRRLFHAWRALARG